MKRILIFASLLLINLLSVKAQTVDIAKVPVRAKAGFEKEFPGVKGKWEKEKNNFEVNFTKDGKSMSAVFDDAGALLETETTIAKSALPAAILTYIQSHYKNAIIKEAAEIVKAGGMKTYEAEVNGKDLLFDTNGHFIKKSED